MKVYSPKVKTQFNYKKTTAYLIVIVIIFLFVGYGEHKALLKENAETIPYDNFTR